MLFDIRHFVLLCLPLTSIGHIVFYGHNIYEYQEYESGNVVWQKRPYKYAECMTIVSSVSAISEAGSSSLLICGVSFQANALRERHESIVAPSSFDLTIMLIRTIETWVTANEGGSVL